MSNNGNIWVVDDERSIRWVLEKALTQHGWDVECSNLLSSSLSS